MRTFDKYINAISSGQHKEAECLVSGDEAFAYLLETAPSASQITNNSATTKNGDSS